MINALEEKIRTIDSYIQKLDNSISNKDVAQAKNLQDEIIAVTRPMITRILFDR